MSERNFRESLQEAERARDAQTLSPEAERRIRARAQAHFDRPRRFALPAWGLVVAGVAVMALSVFALMKNGADRNPEINGFVADNGSDVPDLTPAQGDAVVATAARAEIFDPGSRIHVVADRGATLKRDVRGLRVLSGKVEVHVEKRAAGEAPAVVYVSDGAIEILGTRFTIEQAEHGGGQVTLHEGSIRFRAADGRERMMVPGETLAWPLPVATAPSLPAAPVPSGVTGAPANAGAAAGAAIAGDGSSGSANTEAGAGPSASASGAETRGGAGAGASAPATTGARGGAIASTTPQKSRAAEPKLSPVPAQNGPVATAPTQPAALDVDGLIEEINVLRRRGQFADAASRLESALKSPLPDATSERLSYELGSILTWQLKDAAKACAVWKTHRAAHPNGRYAAEVQRAETSLGCN